MQNDYFNKLQGGSPLFMKSDHDGDNDAQMRNMSLGIKSAAQGVEHFTDWKGLSDKLEQNNLANFEDNQPNRIEFSQSYSPVTPVFYTGSEPYEASTYEYEAPVSSIGVYESKSFSDEWSANKIKVLDDMAFVGYDDFTDLHRVDIDLPDVVFRQYAITGQGPTTSNSVTSQGNSLGSLCGSTVHLPNRSTRISANKRENLTFGSDSTETFNSPYAFADYHNSFLRVEFESGEIAYFLYGGAINSTVDSYDLALNTDELQYYRNPPSSNPTRVVNGDIELSTCRPPLSNNITRSKHFDSNASFADGTIWGRFCLVVYRFSSTGDYGPLSGSRGETFGISDTYRVGIQLTVQCDNSTLDFERTIVSGGEEKRLFSIAANTKSVKLVKIQPVRKCGKVDIYTKKRSIVGAVLSNKITSNNHNLNTNDIIEISNALFDGSQNGVADTHPLNGTKYVRVIDNDTFEVFEDKFFERATSTADLRTTDGITWKCLSNNFGTTGQSWDYHGTMFSPTGRNGYKFAKNTADKLARSSEFFTDSRVGAIDDKSSNEKNTASISLKFDAEYEDLVNTYFAKDIDEKIRRSFDAPAVDFYSPLDSPERAYWDFYPYDCRDNKNDTDNTQKSSYWGSRFGCDLDVKFSHMSGDSRVYVLAVGERGSDVAVDLYGFEDDIVRVTTGSTRDYVRTWSARSRAIPWSLPHGKTHLISITVDQYNRISDISHSNTLFGGGSAIVDPEDNNTDGDLRRVNTLKEYNPWHKSLLEGFRNSYFDRSNNGMASVAIDTVLQYESGDSAHYHYPLTTFLNSGGLHVYNSSYWVRSAVLHWFSNDIHDYKVKSESERTSNFLRNIHFNSVLPEDFFIKNGRQFVGDLRTTLSVEPDNVNNRSRFGSVGFGGSFTPYKRIDRYPSDNTSIENITPYIFPFVDSFGKSVALKTTKSLRLPTGSSVTYSDSDPKLIVVSASTSKSNIEYSENDNSIPLATSDLLTEEDTRARIGQLQANFLYDNGSGFSNVDFMYINSDGSDCGRFFANPTLRQDPSDTLGISVSRKRSLKTGTQAGFGMEEVMSSCSLSALCIEWYDDKLVWADQHLYGNKATVNILAFDDDADNCFTKSSTINKSYLDSRTEDGTNTGDGFGIDFKYDGSMFVTNARDKTTELGYQISDHLADRDRLDYIFVYEKLKSHFNQTQKISASIDKTDEDKYSLALLSYESSLLDLPGAATYDNNSVNTLTWDVDFAGRYDIINNKILIKDPLEYALLSRNYSVQEQSISSSATEEYADMYMAISENSRNASKRSNSLLQYSYIPQETSEYSCRQVGGPRSASVTNSIPLLYFKLPISDLDTIENLDINFDIIDEDILSSFSLKGDTELVDQPDNIIPRVVLYSRDPRATIIPNGPADTGSSNTFPKYQNGIWTEVENIVDGGEYHSYDFPGWYRGGAQDMFFYGRLPAGIVKTGSVAIPSQPPAYLYGGESNLGEYYDATGNPAWIAPDVFRHYTQQQINSLVPYAKIFLPQASQEGYNVNIPRDVLKDFIITKNHIKDTERPYNVVSKFDDSANMYDYDDINHSIVIGFLLTNIESFDLNSSTLIHEEPTTEFSVGPLQYILKDQGEDYANARYAYSNTCNFYNSSFDGAEYSGRRVEYDLSAIVKSVSVSLAKRQNTQGRYSNKFHKIATFAYDQESRDEVLGRYDFTASSVLRGQITFAQPFGSDTYLPVPNFSNKNPLIYISRKSTSFKFDGANDIITSENISSTNNGDSSAFNIDTQSGDVQYDMIPSDEEVQKSVFNNASLLGSFDIDDDKFLPLHIRTNRIEKDGIRLYEEGAAVESGIAPLKIRGLAGHNKDMSLWTGFKFKDNEADLFTFAPFADKMSLFIHEVMPEKLADLFVRSVDVQNDMTLVMAPTISGAVPLNVLGPQPFNNAISLARVPAFSGDISTYIQGKDLSNGDISLNMDAVQPVNAGSTLTFSPGFSGISPLFLARNLESSGVAPLVLPNVLGVHSGSMPLKISRNTIESDSTLFIKPQRYQNTDSSLYVNSQIENSSDASLVQLGPTSLNSNLNTYIRSIFPSGEMDLVIKPIDRLTNSGVSLYMENANTIIPLHINQLENTPVAPAYILGESIKFNDDSILFLKNQVTTKDTSLFVAPIDYLNENTSLAIDGSLNSSVLNVTPLFVGKEVNANNDMSLVVFNNIVGDPNSASANGLHSVAISGGLGASDANTSALYIEPPSHLSGVATAPAFLKTTEPVLSDGGFIIDSSNINVFVSGNNDAGVYFKDNIGGTLHIRNSDLHSTDATLYLNRPIEQALPLNVYHSIDSSGTLSVAVSGQFLQNSGINMFIDTPDVENSIDIFLNPYLE